MEYADLGVIVGRKFELVNRPEKEKKKEGVLVSGLQQAKFNSNTDAGPLEEKFHTDEEELDESLNRWAHPIRANSDSVKGRGRYPRGDHSRYRSVLTIEKTLESKWYSAGNRDWRCRLERVRPAALNR